VYNVHRVSSDVERAEWMPLRKLRTDLHALLETVISSAEVGGA
jgi:hypothetical protein